MSLPQAYNPLYAGPYILPVGVPAQTYLKNLTGAQGQTSILSAPVQGLYRVTMSLCVLTAGAAGTLTGTVASLNSAGGALQQSMTALSVTAAGNQIAQAFSLEVAASQAGLGSISFLVSTGGGFSAGSLNYTCRVLVERVSTTTS